MGLLADLLEALEQIEAEIDREMGSREVPYSGFEDGFNSGVQEATEAYRKRVEAFLAKWLSAQRDS